MNASVGPAVWPRLAIVLASACTVEPEALTPSPTPCGANEFVSGGQCQPCPMGTIRIEGDDPTGPDTECAVDDACTRAFGLTCAVFDDAYLKASNADPRDEFGQALSLSADGRTLAVGAWREDSQAPGVDGDQDDNAAVDAGAVYVFARDDGGWRQQAYLKASLPGGGSGGNDGGDHFGWSLSLSADGNTLSVGAQWEDSGAVGVGGDESDDSAERSGAVYIFVRREGQWTQQAYLKASDTRAGDHFGEDVSLSASGDTLAVGALRNDIDSLEDAGAAYVFERNGGTWGETAYLLRPEPQPGDIFGDAISLSGDGDLLAVGAPRAEGLDSPPNSGIVFLYARAGGAWTLQSELQASNANAEDVFGRTLSLNRDGTTLAVGAPLESSGADGEPADNSALRAGAVYVFVQEAGRWTEQAYLKASNAEERDVFYHLSISDDGNLLAVGAGGEDSGSRGVNGNRFSNSEPDSGAVYLFARAGGFWSERAYVKASNTGQTDAFERPALSGDGSTLAVGAYREDSSAKGVDGDDPSDNEAVDSGAVFVRRLRDREP